MGIKVGTQAEYSEDCIKRAEFIAKIFSTMPDEKGNQLLAIADAFVDGLKAGMQIADRQDKKEAKAV